MLNPNTDENLVSIEKVGYMLSELYYSFCKFIDNKREYDVKGSMRGAEPILHTAKWLAANNLADTSNWSELWINRSIATQGFSDLAKAYMHQEQADQPFSLADNGYDGEISNRIKASGNKKLQTFLLASWLTPKEAKKRNTRIFLGQNTMSKVLDTDDQIFSSGDIFERLLEAIPREHFNYDSGIFTSQPDGCVNPEPQKITDNYETKVFSAFYTGFDKGLIDCSRAVESNDKTQLIEYLKILAKHPGLAWVLKGTSKSHLRNGPIYEEFNGRYESIKNIYKKGQEK